MHERRQGQESVRDESKQSEVCDCKVTDAFQNTDPREKSHIRRIFPPPAKSIPKPHDKLHTLYA